MIRIISGKHKNRIIPTLKGSNYRPTTGKLREAIFSIITSGEFGEGRLVSRYANVLDLFAGTGSLAFEALSRGAASVTLVDINNDYLRLAREYATLINERERVNILNLNATTLPKASKMFDLVFIDPPYYNNLVPKAIYSLQKGGWLKDEAILVVELGRTEDFADHSLELIKEKVYGDSKLLILRNQKEIN